MSAPVHTYGPTCLLYEPDTNITTVPDSNEIIPPPPKIRSQFFYLSTLPIDDPLTPIPPPSSSSSTSQAKLPPRPFSVRDNIALEEAWYALRNELEDAAAGGDDHEHPEGSRPHDLPIVGPQASAGNETCSRYGVDSGNVTSGRTELSYNEAAQQNENVIGFYISQEASGSKSGPKGLSTSHQREGSGDSLYNTGRVTPSGDVLDTARDAETRRKRHSPPIEGRSKIQKCKGSSTPSDEDGGIVAGSGKSSPRTGRYSAELSVSGSPFIRAPARERPEGATGSPLRDTRSRGPIYPGGKSSPTPSPKVAHAFVDGGLDRGNVPSSDTTSRPSSAESEIDLGKTVTVGASRLHLVELPKLKMKPIYWSPVHDISTVVRATWFYKNSMLPVEPDLANHLEEGYMELKPWTKTWQDELNSCIENGAEAEMKVVYRLWSKEDQKLSNTLGSRQGLGEAETAPTSERPRSRRADYDFSDNKAAGFIEGHLDAEQQFKKSSVIYVNAKDAQILRPNLLPSASRGRRPLSSIRKGRQIGTAVVRGFSPQVWDKLHPSKFVSTSARNFMKMHQIATNDPNSRRRICYACQMEDKKQDVSDLVLVIHGIGQKLSERMESFHFTHAINAFRRQVNVELSSETVWPHMRPEQENIMVLPVNWRSTLSLDDAGVGAPLPEDPNANNFGLKDITPETIPSVRNLISDVMLDIPYYLSHHKQKMVIAVIKEANRIYRLWCQNNPGFQTNGRVHLIAHSLGSIMAMDILSQQPTKLPFIDFSVTEISETKFEFDTKSVFFCGSPAGFFLLLNKSTLLPRKGRNKPGYDSSEDAGRGVAGEAGTYGCLAVDNLYNVMHETDPIAYRLNATVDNDLANSLKFASIPTSSTSFLQAMGSVFRWGSQPQVAAMSVANSTAGPSAGSLLSKLPSNIEMETHDFTREEIAEKRMSLLNDNGQIDFYISGGGGPLNIQYLNMLSAHSSYWILQDFVRFIVVEIGRVQGRDGVLVALRAEKKKGWKRARG